MYVIGVEEHRVGFCINSMDDYFASFRFLDCRLPNSKFHLTGTCVVDGESLANQCTIFCTAEKVRNDFFLLNPEDLHIAKP